MNINSPTFKLSFGNKLDSAITSGQSGQTVGIPIGPDTSIIFAEIVACEIEQLIKQYLADFDTRTVRFVDDMIIGVAETETLESVLSKFSSALYQYELELNGAKTQVNGVGYPHHLEWRHSIRSFIIAKTPARQKEDLDSFFEQALQLSDSNPP